MEQVQAEPRHLRALGFQQLLSLLDVGPGQGVNTHGAAVVGHAHQSLVTPAGWAHGLPAGVQVPWGLVLAEALHLGAEHRGLCLAPGQAGGSSAHLLISQRAHRQGAVGLHQPHPFTPELQGVGLLQAAASVLIRLAAPKASVQLAGCLPGHLVQGHQLGGLRLRGSQRVASRRQA